MRVYIGPYVNWIGPYQIAGMIPFISKDTKDKVGSYLSKTWVDRFCNWIHENKERKVKVRIDDYDTWNADQTLALIILPLLKRLKENKYGSPFVDNEDVPPELRYDDPEPGYDENGNWNSGGGNWVHYKWEWVLNEIIWTFEQLNSDWELQYYGENFPYDETDINGIQAHQKRISNGLRLFGKYYQGLWN